MRLLILRQSVTADCDTIYSMRKSIWFILAAVLVLAACGSQEPDLAQDTRSSAVEAPSAVATIPIPEPTPANTSTPVPTPTNLPAPSPPPAIFMPPQLPAAAFLPIPTKTPTPQTATTASAPTPAAGPEKPALSEDRTIYAPDRSTSPPASPTPAIDANTLAPTPETLAAAESRRILRSTLAQTWESATPDIDLDDVIELFETGYILVTGKTPEQAGWTPLVLSEGKYIDFVTVRHPGDDGFIQATSYCCETTIDGLQTVVNGDTSPGTVLTSLAHEAGHALQRINNPAQNPHSRDSNVGAIREAQAYAFEAALIRALGDQANVNVSNLPISRETDAYVDRWRTRWTDKKDDLAFEHERGFLILWLAALADSSVGGAAEQIASQNRIVDSATLFDLHRSLVAVEPRDAASYIDSLFENLNDSLNIISGTISIRATQFPSPGSVEDSHAPYVVP